MLFTRTSAFALAIGLILTSTACSRVRNTQGYIVDEELVASVQPGVDNKESVTRTLGRPTMIADWDDNTWYYISRTTEQLAFLRPNPEEQTLLVIRFRQDGNVASVDQRGLEQVVDISPNSDKTRTMGRESGLLQDLFGNIGQVGAAPGAQ